MEPLWFVLVALMITAYVILDGFDLGAGALHLGVPGKSCTSGCEANWYERSLKWDEERSIRQSRS